MMMHLDRQKYPGILYFLHDSQIFWQEDSRIFRRLGDFTDFKSFVAFFMINYTKFCNFKD